MSGEIEVAKCDFCHQEKHVERTYLRPSKYVKPEDPKEYIPLYNEGNYFIIIWTCTECGTPKSE